MTWFEPNTGILFFPEVWYMYTYMETIHHVSIPGSKRKNPEVCSTSDASTSQAGRLLFFFVTVVFSGWRFGLQRLDYLNHSGVGSFLEWIVLGWMRWDGFVWVWLPSLKLTEHLKIDGWKMNFLLGRPIFRGYVFFKECISLHHITPFMILHPSEWQNGGNNLRPYKRTLKEKSRWQGSWWKILCFQVACLTFGDVFERWFITILPPLKLWTSHRDFQNEPFLLW